MPVLLAAPRPERPPLPARQRGSPLISTLRTGEVELLGLIPGASNETYLCTVTAEDTILAVYKPRAGETPLSDFPDGTLFRREAAAALLDDIIGWDLVPPTIVRDDLPRGPGSLQAYIEPLMSAEVAEEEGVLEPVELFPVDAIAPDYLPIFAPVLEDGSRVVLAHEDTSRLRQMALFDAVANNADRKGAHLIVGSARPGSEPRLQGIDHGLTFHAEPKLRTVLWGFAGEALTEDERARLEAAAPEVSARLGEHLDATEVRAARQRCDALVAGGAFPAPPEDRPAIPWPPL